GTGYELHLAVRLDLDADALERRQAGVLDIARDAHAEMATLAARLRLPGAEILAVVLQRGVEAGTVVTAVVDDRIGVAAPHARRGPAGGSRRASARRGRSCAAAPRRDRA